MIEPILKWVGGKRWLVNDLSQMPEVQAADRIVEPFAGALAVSLGLGARRVLANDLNSTLMGLHRGLKTGKQFDLLMTPNHKRYYRYRNRFNVLIKQDPSSWECAQLFYYLNKTGYNGLCRYNRDGGYNVPVGSYSKVDYDLDTDAYRKQFRQWVFKSGDFSKLVIKSGDFVFVDPPYHETFSSYNAESFDWNDQERTALWASQLEVPVVCTNSSTKPILRLYTDLGFDVRYISAPRRVSSNGNRDAAVEMIAFKNCEPLELKKCRMKCKT